MSETNEKCSKCDVPMYVRTTVHNTPENCKEHITWPYMQIGESMHLECYIQHVIDAILKSKLKENNV